MFKLKFLLGVLIIFNLNLYGQIQKPENYFKRIGYSNIGYDYNLVSFQIGYAYYSSILKTGYFADFTQGTALLGSANFRAQVGLQSWRGSSSRFNLKSSLALVFTQADNQVGSYSGLGLNVQLQTGLQRNRWSVGGDIQYNPFFSTYIHHSEYYKQYYYEGVKDGWYKTTAHNIRLGVYYAASLDKRKSTELNLRGGYQTSGAFDKLIPSFYGSIGVNKKF